MASADKPSLKVSQNNQEEIQKDQKETENASYTLRNYEKTQHILIQQDYAEKQNEQRETLPQRNKKEIQKQTQR